MQQVVAALPMENLLIETDAPALAPLPNKPAEDGATTSSAPTGGDCCGVNAVPATTTGGAPSAEASSAATAATTTGTKGKAASQPGKSGKGANKAAAAPLTFDDLEIPIKNPARNEPANASLSAHAIARIKVRNPPPPPALELRLCAGVLRL